MGRSYTPTYRLEMQGSTAMAWQRHYGRPTTENIEKYINGYVKSQAPGNCNAHIAKALGYLHVPTWGRVIRQRDNQVMAEWKMPPFYCFGGNE